MTQNAPRTTSGLLLVALALLVGGGRVEAAAPRRAQLGRCASYIKRLHERGSGTGIVRPDLYEGLTGWIAMKTRVSPGDVDGMAAGSPPDVEACQDLGLAKEPLLGLEKAVAKVPADRLQGVIEECLAALRLLERSAQGSRREAVVSATLAQTRTVGRLLGYVAKDKKPATGAVEARMETLLRESASGPWTSPAFGRSLQGCESVGVDVDLLRRTHEAG